MDRLDYPTPPVGAACQQTTEQALRSACQMLHDAPPSVVTRVALSIGLRNAREAWRVRAVVDELAATCGLCADVRASDERVLVLLSRSSSAEAR
jgi:hypothetical protein